MQEVVIWVCPGLQRLYKDYPDDRQVYKTLCFSMSGIVLPVKNRRTTQIRNTTQTCWFATATRYSRQKMEKHHSVQLPPTKSGNTKVVIDRLSQMVYLTATLTAFFAQDMANL